MFCVDEIIIFDDGQTEATSDRVGGRKQAQEESFRKDQKRDPNALLELLLSYSECPPYLRKALFEYHPDLGKSGLLQSLDIPHHLKSEEWCQYREAVSMGPVVTNVLNGTSAKRQRRANHGGPETFVDAGFPVAVAGDIPINTRLTIKFAEEEKPHNFADVIGNFASYETGERPQISAEAVDPALPREEAGYYWGYTVRRAATISAVFTESPYEDGYDVSIGTSERGQSLQDTLHEKATDSGITTLPPQASHALLVIGGVAGLEVAVDADKDLASKGIGRDNIADLFDFYVNICPGQGSRTIRSEEALWIALGQLRMWVLTALL